MIVDDMSLSSPARTTTNGFRHHIHPSQTSLAAPASRTASRHRRSSSAASSVSYSSIGALSSSEEESYTRGDYGLESPTIVSHLIETVRKESKMTSSADPMMIPPPRGFEEFQTLSSTKQNIELFKILSAIADEIEGLRVSTERRFSLLETLVQPNKQNFYGIMPKASRSETSNSSSHQKGVDAEVESGAGNGSSGTTTRPASWPRDPPRQDSSDINLMIARNNAEDRPVLLNIGGRRYEVTWALLDKLPNTRLGRLRKCRTEDEILKLADGYDPEINEFKFDRQPRNFNCVLNFLNTGKLHLGEETCVIAFSQDLEYWEVDELYLESCCVQRYYQQRELLTWDHQVKKEEELEVFRPGRIGRLQKILWDLFEKPHTSIGARVAAIISITFIVVSTVVLTLNTLPYFDLRDENNNEKDYPPFALLEAIYMSWFTFEFLIRLVACPSVLKFAKSPMNVIDLLAILPYYVSIALVNSTSVGQLTEVRRIAQFFRIMRILRIFKLARHSVGLQSLGFTIRNSYKELGLLLLFLSISVLIFASLVFVFEKDEPNTTFSNMLDAYWWALITMTTVGYGDISPTTILGKFIGSWCAICGVLVIALPIPIIGNNFAAFYKNERRRGQLADKKGDVERARRKGAITPFPKQNGFNPEDGSGDSQDSPLAADANGKRLDITELDPVEQPFEQNPRIARKKMSQDWDKAPINRDASSSLTRRRYEVSSGSQGDVNSHENSNVKYQTINMSVTSASNHVATQNNVMMSSVAVDTSQRSDLTPYTLDASQRSDLSPYNRATLMPGKK